MHDERAIDDRLKQFIIDEERVSSAMLLWLLMAEFKMTRFRARNRARRFLRKHRDVYRFAGGVLYAH